MRNYLTFLAVVCSLLVYSCTSNTTEEDPVLNIDTSDLKFEAAGGVPQTVAVTANVEWSATPAGSASEWLTVDKTDDKTFTVSAKANPTTEERNAKIVVSATAAKVKSKEISVKQTGKEKEKMSLSVSPAALTFAGEDAPVQEVTVTAVGEGLTWTVAKEEEAEWVHLQTADDKIAVTVDDNPNTIPRAVNIVVTPSDKSVEAKKVKVTQEEKILSPSLNVSMGTELHFNANVRGMVHTIEVEAVKTEWTAATSDGKGGAVDWIILDIHNTNGESFVDVTATNNPAFEERSGFVVISATAEGIDPITLDVTQGADKISYSTLTEDVDITDMTAKTGHNEVQFFPNSPGDDQPYIPDHDPDTPVTPIPGRASAKWDLLIWGDNLTYDKSDYPYVYRGSGNRMKLDIRSERILYNYDEEFYLPDGEYEIALNTDEAPNTVTYGQYEDGGDNETFPRGSWYYRVENDGTTAAAPLAGGKVTVHRNGAEYTLTFDLVDDAGNKITGTCTAVFEMNVMYFPPDGEIGGGEGAN